MGTEQEVGSTYALANELRARLKVECDALKEAFAKKARALDDVERLLASLEAPPPSPEFADNKKESGNKGSQPEDKSKQNRRNGASAIPVEPEESTKPIDHRVLLKELLGRLPNEFTSHDYRELCLEKFPGRPNEFTMLKVKKRLNRYAGFENAEISLIAKGGGRGPPKYKKNLKT